MMGLIIKMQQQLAFLENKIDTLIGKIPEKPFQVKQDPKPFQRFDHSYRQREARQDNHYRERILHKAICADCSKECEVPFKPSGDRPVYCKDCFAKRKVGSSFKASTDKRPGDEERIRERPSYKHAGVENRRPYEKKRVAKKRKKRS